MKKFKYIAATSLKQAASVLSKAGKEESVKLVAGGTDLLGALKNKINSKGPDTIVDIKSIPGLSYIRSNGKYLRIGALTRLREIASNKEIKENYRMLALAARSVASPQIRNMGTIGGNICQEPRCWYYRSPDDQFHCLRKGGTKCSALLGENRYHSIFGGIRAGDPSCTYTCPGHVNIAAYMSEMRSGEINRAANTILSNNPMPALTGRVCPHYCESACNRGNYDGAVSIRNVERFLGDYILDHPAGFMKAPKKQTSKSVAIVGSGPAGLSAAYYLRALGYKVTVFDKMPTAGGMLTYSIPGYRLSKDVVRKQIKAYEKMGIKFILNARIGEKGSTLRDLKKKFSCVFLTTGTWRQKELKLEKSELLTSGMDFLARIARNEKQSPGNRVLVIGGGNVAVDVAISALRIGAKEVTMACLEDRETMPAFPEEIEAALQEGVRLETLVAPVGILSEGGKLSGIECIRNELGEIDQSGRRRPVAVPGSQHVVPLQTLIVAISEGSDTDCVAVAGANQLEVDEARKTIRVDEETLVTSRPGVFAGGDVVTGPNTVVDAIAAGQKVAVMIDRYLHHEPLTPAHALRRPGVYIEPAKSNGHSASDTARVELPRIDAEARRQSFSEVEKTLSTEDAIREAGRCLRCDLEFVHKEEKAEPVCTSEEAGS